MRITIAMSMLAALFRVCWCFLRVVGVLDLSTREYGTCGTRIGLARRGARALLDCHDGKDRVRWRALTVFPRMIFANFFFSRVDLKTSAN